MKREGWGTRRSSDYGLDSLERTGPRLRGMGRELERRQLNGRGMPLEELEMRRAEQGMPLAVWGMRRAVRFWRAERSLTTESKENPTGLTGLPRLDAESPVFFLSSRGYFPGSNFRDTPFMQ